MRRFRLPSTCLILFLISFSFCSEAQPGTTNSLLWRISGNGLKSPSYLFGTLHLNDERIFNFGDSVYQAILNSDGFAMELSPQQLTLIVIDQIKQKIVNSKKISEVLSESDYKKYSPRLAKKMGKVPADITTEDVIKEKNKWISEKFKSGKMQTFVDVYLYDIARRKGKWTGGVEDLQDQASLVSNVVDKSDIVELLVTDYGKGNHELENMINAYAMENLNAIAKMSSSQDSLYNDKVVVRRNIRMSERMDSMSRVRTMFYAVGAAHLPGPTGIIELLRKKGFQVEPVISSRKVSPKDYVIEEKPAEWEINKDDAGLYQVAMPGRAEELRLYGTFVMKVYIDFTKSSGYFTTAVTTVLQPEKLDSSLDKFSHQLFPDSETRIKRDISLAGAKGKEYMVRNEDGIRKGYLLSSGNKLFIVVGFSTKDSKEGLVEIDRFLHSFRVNKSLPLPSTQLVHYIDTLRSFELDLPSDPVPVKEYSGERKAEGVKTVMNISVDERTGATYLFSTSTTLAGSLIDNDSTYMQKIVGKSKLMLDSLTCDSSYFQNSIRVHEIAGILKDSKVQKMRGRYYIRNNRLYILVATCGADRPDGFTKWYFESFHFREFPAAHWRTETSADSVLSAFCPSDIVATELKGPLADRLYEAIDTNSAQSYYIGHGHLKDYYWAKTDSIFWDDRVLALLGKNDTIIYKRVVTNADVPFVEYIKNTKGSMLRDRYRIYRYGDELFSAYTIKTPDQINDENTNRFFESIKFKKPAPQSNFLKSHAGLLLSSLFSRDSATSADALTYIRIAPFDTNDLDTMHKAIIHISICDVDNPVKKKWYKAIIDRIISLHDKSSFEFARDAFKMVADSNAELKNALLEIMVSYPTLDNYKTIAEMLRSGPPESDLSVVVRNRLKDTCTLTAQIMQTLLPLLNNSYLSPSIMDICNSLIDSNLLDRSQLSTYVTPSVLLSKKRVELLLEDTDNYYTLDIATIRFLGNLKSQVANTQLKAYLPVKDNYIKYKALKELINNNIPVDPSVYLQIASDKYYRIFLYNYLKEKNKLNLFPITYKTQKSFAESEIWASLIEDDYEPVTIKYLTQKSQLIKGRPTTFYFFKVWFDGDEPEQSYLIGCGPYLPKSSFPMEETISKRYFDDVFDSKNMQSQIDALLKSYSNGD